MFKSVVRGAMVTAILAAGASVPAQAAVVLFSDNFDGGGYALNKVPDNWTYIAGSGTVDWIQDNTYGLRCDGNTGGCVDLDGTSNNAGIMTNGTYTLVAGTTYTLTARVSGNQRGTAYPSLAGPDTVNFGFRNAAGPIGPVGGAWAQVTGIVSTDPFTLFKLVYTPGSTITGASIFFEALGGDNVGPILDNVTLTAVPLPAAALLLLSGLVGVGALGRRKT